MHSFDVDPIPISALQHWAFCPRQCALIHVERVWAENASTFGGRVVHERVDEGRGETDHGVRVEYGLPLWCDRLGLIGKADCVEFDADGSIRPVEYKRGPRKRRLADDIQLCAQALCLEEMFDRRVSEGDIFHAASRRRRAVALDGSLRAETERTIEAVRVMLEAGALPGPVNDARCGDCSLRGVCVPEIAVSRRADRLFEPLDPEDNNA